MAVELLAPAGDRERLEMAVRYGANAVYLAGNEFGMRAFAGNFTPENLKETVDFCHSHGVDVHVTCNTMPRNGEMDGLQPWLEVMNDAGVDAVIAADLAIFQMAAKYAPKLKRHISTQSGITNYMVAQSWHDLGADRVILARELSLEEVITLRQKTHKDLEIEAFVHGAMCVSYSGRCLISNYMTNRDAQRGACSQPCRFQYALVEEKRPGEYYEIFEENNETFIMNSKDMCMIDHIPELITAGLDSLKIEGRAKSAYYAAAVTGAYRHAIDAAEAGQPLSPIWRDEVYKVSHRPYSTGFWFGQPEQHTGDGRYIREWQVVAVVLECDDNGMAKMSLRNKFAQGEELEILSPDTEPFTFTVPEMADMRGNALDEVRNPQMEFMIQLPKKVAAQSLVRACRPHS